MGIAPHDLLRRKGTPYDELGLGDPKWSDDEIIEAYQLMARREGIFCEPASAASVAGLIKTVRSGVVLRDSVVVCIITGHGLKDPALAMELTDRHLEEAPADLEAVAQILAKA
jgi:threonine synthase